MDEKFIFKNECDRGLRKLSNNFDGTNVKSSHPSECQYCTVWKNLDSNRLGHLGTSYWVSRSVKENSSEPTTGVNYTKRSYLLAACKNIF